ncbi:MAG: hypothetical protein WCG98_05275 [bacterium]
MVKITAQAIPENIDDVQDSILQKVIICETSGRPFKIISAELVFYRNHGLPVPRQHPDMRYQERLSLRPPRTLYVRTCDHCSRGTLSVYPQNTTFKVYCESCYNKEIY